MAAPSLKIRSDLPGRFNELDVLRRFWPLYSGTIDGTILPPFEVLIHPSSRCNLRCAWCIGDHVPIQLWNEEDSELTILDAAKTATEVLPDHLIPVETMMKLVRDIVDYQVEAKYRQNSQEQQGMFQVQNVSFSGLIGEPLVAKEAVLAAMRFLVSNGKRVGIFTNGVLMDDSVIDVFLNIAYVHVSIDAGTASSYATLKFGGRASGEVKFAQAKKNLRQLVKRRNDERSKLEISTSFVMYPENYAEVYDAAKMLKEIGVDRMRLKQDISNDHPLSAEQAKDADRIVNLIRRDLVDSSFELLIIHPFDKLASPGRSFTTCTITNLIAAVGSDGHLYPCNYHPRPGGWSYGSAIESSFREVWEGSVRRHLRTQLPDICPKVCDPFKNRANHMLAWANSQVAEHGIDFLEETVDEMLDERVYNY